MVPDIIYNIRRQIEVHQYHRARPEDLRILMSERQMYQLERVVSVNDSLPYRMDPLAFNGIEPNHHNPELSPSIHGVEVIYTQEDQPLPYVVRLAST